MTARQPSSRGHSNGSGHRFCSSHRLCERSEAIHSCFLVVLWIASRSLSSGAHSRDPLARNDDEHNSAISPRVAPELLHQSFAQSGRGECRVPAAPAASCAKCRKHTSVVTTSSPEHPAFPHAMVLTAASCSPRRSGFLVTVASRKLPQSLTPASRRQDHTTWPSASPAPLVKSAARVHRIPSRVRDDRDTPLHGDGTAADVEVIWAKREVGIFFRTGLDR